MQPNVPQGLVEVKELILDCCDFLSAWKDTGTANSIPGLPSSDSSGFSKRENSKGSRMSSMKSHHGKHLFYSENWVFSISCVLLKSLSIHRTEHILFCKWFYLWFLPGIDLNSDSIEDLRDLIKDSSLVDWKHKLKFIFYSKILKLLCFTLTYLSILPCAAGSGPEAHLIPKLCLLQ